MKNKTAFAIRATTVFLWFALLGLSVPGLARAEPDIVLDATMRDETINNLSKEFEARYVYPEVGKLAGDAIRERKAQGQYDHITDGPMLASTLTDQLIQLTHDKHVFVRFHSAPFVDGDLVGGSLSSDAPVKIPSVPADLKKHDCRPGNAHYFFFGSVQCLPGNIGYLKLTEFPMELEASDILAAAMDQIVATDALIIDMRENGGGYPETVSLLASYFFDKPTHLSDIYFRDDNRIHEFWTSSYVDSKKYGAKKDLYILTSVATFSGGEKFTFDLKSLHRATVIGATTGGGANGGNAHKIQEHFEAFIPVGRVVSSMAPANWEGVGIAPDVEVSEYDALETAEAMALKKLIANPQTKNVASLRSRLDALTR